MLKSKIVIVLRNDLPAGVAANAAAVLAVSLAAGRPELLGPDLADADGNLHRGLTNVPLPILATDAVTLAGLARAEGEIQVIDFSETAARAQAYPEYAAALAETPTDSLKFLAVALIGPAKQVTGLTGDLPLYR